MSVSAPADFGLRAELPPRHDRLGSRPYRLLLLLLLLLLVLAVEVLPSPARLSAAT